MLGKERGEEARVPSWESSELHTSDFHTHIWVVPKELFSKPREWSWDRDGEQSGALVPIYPFEESCTWV